MGTREKASQFSLRRKCAQFCSAKLTSRKNVKKGFKKAGGRGFEEPFFRLSIELRSISDAFCASKMHIQMGTAKKAFIQSNDASFDL